MIQVCMALPLVSDFLRCFSSTALHIGAPKCLCFYLRLPFLPSCIFWPTTLKIELAVTYVKSSESDYSDSSHRVCSHELGVTSYPGLIDVKINFALTYDLKLVSVLGSFES